MAINKRLTKAQKQKILDDEAAAQLRDDERFAAANAALSAGASMDAPAVKADMPDKRSWLVKLRDFVARQFD